MLGFEVSALGDTNPLIHRRARWTQFGAAIVSLPVTRSHGFTETWQGGAATAGAAVECTVAHHRQGSPGLAGAGGAPDTQGLLDMAGGSWKLGWEDSLQVQLQTAQISALHTLGMCDLLMKCPLVESRLWAGWLFKQFIYIMAKLLRNIWCKRG